MRNIDTDLVASMIHKNGSGIGLQCDYVVTDGEPLSEGLNLAVIVGRVRLATPGARQEGRGSDKLQLGG